MKRQNIFTFRVSNQERQLISELAKHLQRSQSDAVRFVVTEAARHLSQVQTSLAPALSVRPTKLKQEGTNVAE